jgi:AcrR family transcriptional regulator
VAYGDEETPRKVGRPRNEAARQKILGAALALVREQGLSALTIEGIAARAGVGKQTIYRWWASRADILLEALREHASAEVPDPQTGSLRGDLDAFLATTFVLARDRRVIGPVLRGLMAEAQSDEGLRARFREHFIEARRAALRRVFERAIASGEARSDFEPDVGVDVVFGAMWYRLLVGHLPLDRVFAASLAEAATRAARPPARGA